MVADGLQSPARSDCCARSRWSRVCRSPWSHKMDGVRTRRQRRHTPHQNATHHSLFPLSAAPWHAHPRDQQMNARHCHPDRTVDTVEGLRVGGGAQRRWARRVDGWVYLTMWLLMMKHRTILRVPRAGLGERGRVADPTHHPLLSRGRRAAHSVPRSRQMPIGSPGTVPCRGLSLSLSLRDPHIQFGSSPR
jgi:hypothetical protein